MKDDGWMHYLVVGAGLVFGFFVAMIVFGLLWSLLMTGAMNVIVTILAVWGFVWIVSKLVYVGRQNNWFKWMDDKRE